MSDDREPPADELTIDADSVAPNDLPNGRRSIPCPRCETPVALVVSYGPLTHRASPCGCPVSRSVLAGGGSDPE